MILFHVVLNKNKKWSKVIEKLHSGCYTKNKNDYEKNLFFRGKYRIRTYDTVTRTLDFESSPINLSGNFPLHLLS